MYDPLQGRLPTSHCLEHPQDSSTSPLLAVRLTISPSQAKKAQK
jgi:hypothetical protein